MIWRDLLIVVCTWSLCSRTVTGQDERCALPPFSNGTKYTIQDCEDCPTTGWVPAKTILVNQCEPGYLMPDHLDLSICLKGSWRPAPPSCIKLCPPLENPTRKIDCRFGDDPVPCTEMMLPKTKASVQCAENYYPHFTGISFLKLECQGNGEWNSQIYNCRPECGYHTGSELSPNKTTVDENAPWHGIIYMWKEGNLTELCAGTMISKHVMLTAAHCVYDEESKTIRDKNVLRVIIGQQVNDRNKTSVFQSEAVVRRIVVDDNYEGRTHNFANDLALMDLKFLEHGGSVIPACVGWDDQEEVFTPGQPGTVPGWAMTSNKESFNITHLTATSNNECQANIPESSIKYFTQDKFCAKDDGAWRKMTKDSPYWDQIVRYNFYLDPNVHSAKILKNKTAKVRTLPGTGITFVKNQLHFIRGVRSIIEPTQDGTFVFTSVTKNLDWNYLTKSSVQQFHEEKTYNINFKDCGLMGTRISKTGEEQNETPWLAMILRDDHYVCGGTIISPHIVVTESQCVRDPANYAILDVRILKVAVGKRIRESNHPEPNEQVLSVQRIIIRRRLVELNLFYEEDIAIVELATNIKFTEDVRPVCIDWRNNKISHDLSNQKLYTPEVRQIRKVVIQEFVSIDMAWFPDDWCLQSLSDFERSRYNKNKFCTAIDPRKLLRPNETYTQRWLSRGEGATVMVDGRHYLYGLRHYQRLGDFQWDTLYTNITTHVPWLETHRLSLEYDRNFQNCGKANPKVALISHGKNATQIEHPWHVGLFYYQKEGVYEQQCGGTLVHPKIVLTAAHCVYFNFQLLEPSKLRIAVGKVNRDWKVLDPEEQRYEVASIIIPASYYGSKGTFRDDIALLNLTEPVEVTDHVLPACIPKNKDSIPVGSNGSVVGWGLTEAYASSQFLQIAVLPTISIESCIAMSPTSFKKFISRDKLCTLYLNETGPQEGDSGGGLTFEINGRHYVYGVVSVKPPMENKFGAFTDVISHFEWVREKTSEIVVDL